MPEIRIPNFTPRDYQLPLWEYLEGGGKRAVAVWHRRSGKDQIALNWACYHLFLHPGNAYHLLPQQQQARRVLWQAVNPHTGTRRIDETFPPELGCRKLENEMIVELPNGATWQCLGSDNYQTLLGTTPNLLTFSEYATSDERAWAYMSPILLENQGTAIFISTPRGYDNHLFKLYDYGRHHPDEWFTEILPATKTNIFTPVQLDEERRNYISLYGLDQGDALFRTEYGCDFSASLVGSYYGRFIEEADRENRITSVPHDPALPVFTSFDLGISDATSIWFLQQGSGGQVRAIDYDEMTDVGIDIIAKRLTTEHRSKYHYKMHIFPHDAKVRELGANAKSRLQILREHGIYPQQVLASDPVEDGINQVRMLLPRMIFDVNKCKRGLECLRNYSRKWDDTRKVYADKPLHDQFSNGCDALRYYAMAHTRTGPSSPIKYPKLGIS